MLGGKYDFKPDREDSGTLNKLHLTKKQRLCIWKWSLYALLMVALSLVQDVMCSRLTVRGTTTDLVPVGLILVCLLSEVDSGAIFALVASVLFVLSGSAPGIYSIALLTALGTISNIFRYSFLRKGFAATFLCGAVSLMLYAMLVFLIGVFLEKTTFDYFSHFLTTGLLNVAVVPVLYPIFLSVSKIGGQTWKD